MIYRTVPFVEKPKSSFKEVLLIFLVLVPLVYISIREISKPIEPDFEEELPKLSDADHALLRRVSSADAFGFFEWGNGELSNNCLWMHKAHYHRVDHNYERIALDQKYSPPHHLFTHVPSHPFKSYIHSALDMEIHGFSVYMVNGLYRDRCAVAAAMHADKTGMDSCQYKIIIRWKADDRFNWLLDYFKVVDQSPNFKILVRDEKIPISELSKHYK